MIGAVHHKLDACCYLTEFAYDEPVTVPFVMMRNVAFKIRVGNVGKIADYYIRIADRRFDIDLFVIPVDRVNFIRVGSYSVFHSFSLKWSF